MQSTKNEKILAAAISLFGRLGFDKTTTQAISQEAGIATGTLFKYYESKEELILAAYVDAKMSLIGALKQDLDPELEFEGIMRHIWDRSIDWLLANPEQHKFMEQVKSSRFAANAASDRLRQEFLFLFIAIKGAQDAGKVAELPQALIEQIISSFLNLAVNYITNFDENRAKTKDDLLKILFKSLKPD